MSNSLQEAPNSSEVDQAYNSTKDITPVTAARRRFEQLVYALPPEIQDKCMSQITFYLTTGFGGYIDTPNPRKRGNWLTRIME